jgi:hypothetical protein
MTDIDFASSGGRLEAFDDGHTPENLPQDMDTPPQLVHYPRFLARPPAVHVFYDALPECVVDALYEKTLQTQQESQTPWGTYVTMEELNDSSNNINDDPVVQATAHYLDLALGKKDPSVCHGHADADAQDETSSSAPHNHNSNSNPLWTTEDLQHVHGVAVWALAAQPGSEVPYHLDYAEQVRYQTNIIVPPLLAGTLQCTRDPIHGGAFQVSLEGLDHYQTHGYKAKKAPVVVDNLISVTYRYNQLLCHAGHLPHASSRIQSIQGNQQSWRVIVGFNVFGHDIGPMVQKAPEHSDAFRRQVQVQRKVQQMITQKKNLDLQSIQNNKPLSKLLVLAKRERIKQKFRAARIELQERLPTLLPATVQHLMYTLGSTDTGYWPAPVDVQVYLHHQVLDGSLRVVLVVVGDESSTSTPPPCTTSKPKDLISPLATLALAKEKS